MNYEDVDVLLPFRPCGDYYREDNACFIEAHLRQALPGTTVTRCDDPDPHLFNRGRAVNAGVEATSRPILIFADGDVWLPHATLREAVSILRRTFGLQRSYVVPFDKIIWMDDDWSRKVLDGDVPIASRPPARHVILEWGQRSHGICNVVKRDRFLEFGGFDPRFVGWGCEDEAFNLAAETLGGPKLRLHAEGRHLYHHSCPSKEDPERMAAAGHLHQRYAGALGKPASMRELIAEGRAAR